MTTDINPDKDSLADWLNAQAAQFSLKPRHTPSQIWGAEKDCPMEPQKRFYVIIDTESMVAEDEHSRYQATERFRPRPGQRDSGRRPGQQGRHDPLTNARWMFQEIKVASVMVCATHSDRNIVPVSFETFSAASLGEKVILQKLFAIVDGLPPQSTELVSYGGCWADVPRLLVRAMKHGLALPRPWHGWVPWGGQGRVPHIDLMRCLTGASKMTASHMAEFAAVMDIPAKMTAAPWTAAELIRRGAWVKVEEMCESDCITTALLLARWRSSHDPAAPIEVIEDRIYRELEALCTGRSYMRIIKQRRRKLFEQQESAARVEVEEDIAT